jgi:hypothetical protein
VSSVNRRSVAVLVGVIVHDKFTKEKRQAQRVQLISAAKSTALDTEAVDKKKSKKGAYMSVFSQVIIYMRQNQRVRISIRTSKTNR